MLGSVYLRSFLIVLVDAEEACCLSCLPYHNWYWLKEAVPLCFFHGLHRLCYSQSTHITNIILTPWRRRQHFQGKCCCYQPVILHSVKTQKINNIWWSRWEDWQWSYVLYFVSLKVVILPSDVSHYTDWNILCYNLPVESRGAKVSATNRDSNPAETSR